MPSFGLPSSMPPGSSSLSPCISSLLSSNISSCPELSCAREQDGSLSSLFEIPYLPPPPLSVTEAAPYSPPPVYPPAYPSVFPFGPPLLPTARFPPPPNSSFSQPFFEAPPAHYPSEPHTASERWPDRSKISTPYGSDNSSSCFPHWSLHAGNHNNFGFAKAEPVFPSGSPYPPLDSVTSFGPKFSPLSRDSVAIPNAAVMPSSASASITSPLAPGHFSSFPPPNLPVDFPLIAGRFAFNPHASSFIPGMDSAPAFGPGAAEFIPEPAPSYLSRTGPFLPSSSFQSPDRFHDASSRPIHSPETAPRPIRSNSPSCFFGSHSQSFHGSSTPNPLLSHSVSSHTNSAAPSALCSTESTLVHESAPDFPAPSALPSPLAGAAFTPYSSAPPVYQDFPTGNGGDSASSQREEDKVERIVSDAGKLSCQHMSPEEWRWKVYEPVYANAYTAYGFFERARSSEYNLFRGADNSGQFPEGAPVREGWNSLGGLTSRNDQSDISETDRAQDHPGPSLKLAASALAEMLGLASNGATSSTSRSMLARLESACGTALTSDGAVGGQAKEEQLRGDCCSSNGSDGAYKEINDSAWNPKRTGAVCGRLDSRSPIRGNLGDRCELEDTFCDFGGAPDFWSLSKGSGQSQSSAYPRPMSRLDVVPQSAKGGPLPASGQRRVFSKAPAGIVRQPSMSIGPLKHLVVNAESSSSENVNDMPSKSPILSPGLHAGRVRKLSSPPVVAVSSEDSPSLVGPLTSTCTASVGLPAFSADPEPSSSGLGRQSALGPFDNEWGHNSTSCGSSPPPQVCLDPHVTMSAQATGTSSSTVPNLKCACPDSSTHSEGPYPGTGFRTLTASISNLSKVLLSLDSAALTIPDSSMLEGTLQSSILRLSECLLSEQSRMNRKVVAASFAGSTVADSQSAWREGLVTGCLTGIDLLHGAKSCGSTNLGYLKASEVDILADFRRSGSAAHQCYGNGVMGPATIGTFEQVRTGGLARDPRGFQKPTALNNVVESQCSVIEGESMTGKKSSDQSYKMPEQMHHSRLEDAGLDYDFFKENDILAHTYLERLLAAEAREAELKVLVHELREELEFEREEKRGVNFLSSFQKADVSKGKDIQIQGTLQAESEYRSETMKVSPLSGESCPDVSAPSASPSKSPVSCKIGPSSDTCANHHQFSSLTVGSLGNLRENVDISALGSNSQDAIQDNLDRIEARLALLQARPTVAADPISFCHATEEINSKMAFIQAQTATLARNLESILATQSTLIGPLDSNMDANQMQLPLVQAQPAAHASSSCGASSGIDQVEPQLLNLDSSLESQFAVTRSNSPLNLCKGIDEVESRLALLQARPGWDSELGAFTEAEPCTPAGATSGDLDIGKGDLDGPSQGLCEGQVGRGKDGLPAMFQSTSHLSAQLETVPDMPAALSKLPEQENPKNMEMKSNTDIGLQQVGWGKDALPAVFQCTSTLLAQVETVSDMSTALSQLPEQENSKNMELESNTDTGPQHTQMNANRYEDSRAIEARARLIRSRHGWREDGSESETEEFLGGQVCKLSSQIVTDSGPSRHESDQFETLNEISLMRLLDSDVESCVPLPVNDETMGPSLDNSLMWKSSTITKGAALNGQDLEDDLGWEHVRLP